MSSHPYSTVQRLQLYLDTIRYARPRQLLHRLRRILKSRWPGLDAQILLDGRVPEVESHGDSKFTVPLRYVTSPERWLARANAVLEGRFTFLNRTVTYPDGPRWDDPEQGRLWRFHLHYFDYAVDLGRAFQTTGDTRYWERFKFLATHWITANPPARGDGWHPFTISLRIVNWIRAYHLFDEPFSADDAFRNRFLASLYAQARYLARNLEYDITGNHLIKNGKALLFAGAFFQGAESTRWFERGLRILVEEAREQILDDGGHYERSPLYQTQVLADYLDALVLVPRERSEYAQLVTTARCMLDLLSAILHPDGALPLFNDSVLWSEPSPAALFQYASDLIGYQPSTRDSGVHTRESLQLHSAISGQRPALSEAERPAATRTNLQPATPALSVVEGFNLQPLTASGYYIFRTADQYLILDCGPVCPDHLPPHAHCDLLSFELSVKGRRIITNSGTYQYQAGPWRDAFRGTAAHNTVQVNDEEQSAIWSSFRVGRRARVLEAAVHRLDTGPYFRGRYVGFNNNRIEHTRELFLLPGPCWVFLDTVRSRKRSEHLTVTSRLHLHPRVQVTMEDDGIRAHRDDVHLKLMPIGEETFRLDQGWFSPDFGMKEPCPVLSFEATGEPPLRLGFVIAPEDVPIEVLGFDASQDDWHLRLRCGARKYRLSSPQPGPNL